MRQRHPLRRQVRLRAQARAAREEVRVETPAGVKTSACIVETGASTRARVDMGEPRLLRKDIPMTGPANEQCVDAVLQVPPRRERRARNSSPPASRWATRTA